MNKKSIIYFIFVILILSSVYAVIPEDNIIVNSKEWKDVYSSINYANLNGKKAGFILNQAYSSTILRTLPQTAKVLAISSRTTPYVKGYKAIIESNGYEGREIVLTNINFELARLLDQDVTHFIIIDDRYGYNAISIASYAAVSKSYVLFANSDNIDEIVNYLQSRKIDNIIVFGQVDREVKEGLAVFSPETINTGDRFDNNLMIVDRYLTLKESKQVLMTNGEFIEESIMNGENPVMFIGKNNVPDSVKEYVKKSPFQVAVLIGNELVGPATYIKRQLGISVFVKFAQGARNPAGSIATIEDLDRFPMPSYKVLISIPEIRYNIATKQLEVTYQNEENLAAYFKSTITIKFNGEELVLGDDSAVFLDGKEIKTIGYDLDFGQNMPDKAIASMYTLFGEAPKSMEYVYQEDKEISFVNIIDDSILEITSVLYDKSKKRFEIEVENKKDIETYASGEITNLLVNSEYKNYGSDKTVLVQPLKKAKIYVNTADFQDADFENNNYVKVKVYYGQRERSMIKIVAGEYQFIIAKGQYIIYGIVIILVILLILLFVLGKKCDNCKHNNHPFAKKCSKCGEKLQ